MSFKSFLSKGLKDMAMYKKARIRKTSKKFFLVILFIIEDKNVIHYYLICFEIRFQKMKSKYKQKINWLQKILSK